jgi:hypothetical protein
MLQFYNKNRDELIGVEPNRDELKSNYLKALNDNKQNYKIKDPFFRKFDKEMKSIQESICNLPEYADILQSVPTKKQDNTEGSCINRILCKYENIGILG